jgi:hypothetical protein
MVYNIKRNGKNAGAIPRKVQRAMENEFFNDEIKKRKSSPRIGRFLFAGILLFLSLFVAKEKKAEKESEE